MTKLLQQVIEEISQLSDEEQNLLAKKMLEEMEIKKGRDENVNRPEKVFDRFSYWMLEANRHSMAITLDLSQS